MLLCRCAALEFFGAVGAVNLLVLAYKTLVCQIQRALLAGETVFMPTVAFIIHNVGSFSKPCDWVVTSRTLLCYKGLVAVHTIVMILNSSKALAR